MGKILYVNFRQSVLMKGDLNQLSMRIDEIDSILDLCDDSRDVDVIENLERELEHIIQLLEYSYNEAKKRERA